MKMPKAVSAARAAVELRRRDKGALDGCGEAARHGVLGREGLDDADRADRLPGEGGGIRQHVLRPARAQPHAAAETDQRQHDDRQRHQHEAGERRAGHDHHRHARR